MRYCARVRSAGADRHEFHRFKQEARTLRRLSHPNIVTVYDVGGHEGRPYIVTELIEGESLGRSRSFIVVVPCVSPVGRVRDGTAIRIAPGRGVSWAGVATE